MSSRYKSANAGDWVGTQVNPFRSWIASLDGEFTLSDSLHLSVVPYFVYGYGGGQLRLRQDLCVLHLRYVPPGPARQVQAGLQHERTAWSTACWPSARASRAPTSFIPADPQATPADVWGHDSQYYYKNANGSPQVAYRFYSTTPTYRAFATNTWTPSDQWTFTVGGAYTWVQRKGWYSTWPGANRGINVTAPANSTLYAEGASTYKKFTPTAGVKFQLDEQNQFFLGVGKAYRAPINTSALYDFWNAAYANAIGAHLPSAMPSPSSR